MRTTLLVCALALSLQPRGAECLESDLRPAPIPIRNYRFDGTISREVLENYLSRSISMEGLLNGRGDLSDNIRMPRAYGR